MRQLIISRSAGKGHGLQNAQLQDLTPRILYGFAAIIPTRTTVVFDHGHTRETCGGLGFRLSGRWQGLMGLSVVGRNKLDRVSWPRPARVHRGRWQWGMRGIVPQTHRLHSRFHSGSRTWRQMPRLRWEGDCGLPPLPNLRLWLLHPCSRLPGGEGFSTGSPGDTAIPPARTAFIPANGLS